MRKKAPAVFHFLIFLSLCACGIEDYPYINAIPQANVQQELNSWATAYVPNENSNNTYFTHFTVYYRIYVSDINQDAPSKSNLSAINSSLYTDYSRVEPYIDNDSIGSSSIGSLFTSMNYQSLSLAEANVVNVLGVSALGSTITFDFNQAPGSIPTIIIGSNTYTLLRSSRGDPRPANRYFLNSPELYDPANINTNVNADVTNKYGMSSSSNRHTYVNFYIVAVGLDSQTLSEIFSTPTFIGVLKLPDPGSGG